MASNMYIKRTSVPSVNMPLLASITDNVDVIECEKVVRSSTPIQTSETTVDEPNKCLDDLQIQFAIRDTNINEESSETRITTLGVDRLKSTVRKQQRILRFMKRKCNVAENEARKTSQKYKKLKKILDVHILNCSY